VIDVVPPTGIQFEYGLAIADKKRMKQHKQASDKIREIDKKYHGKIFISQGGYLLYFWNYSDDF
jgi:hypothetical protein